MKKLVNLLKLGIPYTGVWGIGIICMLTYTVCNTVSVMGMIPLIDRVLTNKPIEFKLSFEFPFDDLIVGLINNLNQQDPLKLLNFICLFLLTTSVLKGLSQYAQQVIMEWISQNIAKDLRTMLFKKFFYLPSSYFVGSRTGEMISRIVGDVNVVQNIFSSRFTNTLLDCLHFFPFLAIVLLIDWKMTIICLFVIPVSLLPIILIGRQIRKISYKTQSNLADLSSNVFELINALKVVKVFGQIDRETDKFKGVCDKTIERRVKSSKKEAILSPITELVGVGTGVFLLWWFAPNVLDGKMSLGIFMTYITCVACMVKPIKTIGKIQVILQTAMAGLQRIDEVLSIENVVCESGGKKKTISFTEQISFENINFHYTEGQNILSDIQFDIKKGNIIAIVGPSGSGKTTLVNLLPRFFDPKGGDVKIDGEKLKDISAHSVRELLGVVSQDPILFNSTIKDNIAYGDPEASMEKIIEVSKLARAHEFISKMELEYETKVGERGVRLSGGEKQRIAIARALIKNPQILIFDEATSALDNENEKLVQEAIDQVMINRTVIVIAHRLSTVVKAHKIIVLNKGKIEQMGTHKELMSQNGLYKKLYEMNFEN